MQTPTPLQENKTITMRITLFFIIGLLFSCPVFAQYTRQGKIEFEKKTNLLRTIDDMDEDTKEWVEKFRAQIPKFTINYFDLYFTPSASLYKPGRESENATKIWFSKPPAYENVVYTDFATRKVTATKEIYEQKFLVQDTMQKIDWKIMDEIRTIADYKCRKAVGKICDSVYVVAFYTDDIVADGGPEMFSGLPGMILEIAIPRLFTTWVATKVEVEPPAQQDMKAPTKGKKTTQADMYNAVKGTFDRWGNFAQRYIWWTLL
jgi:GLPGLI family protein